MSLIGSFPQRPQGVSAAFCQLAILYLLISADCAQQALRLSILSMLLHSSVTLNSACSRKSSFGDVSATGLKRELRWSFERSHFKTALPKVSVVGCCFAPGFALSTL